MLLICIVLTLIFIGSETKTAYHRSIESGLSWLENCRLTNALLEERKMEENYKKRHDLDEARRMTIEEMKELGYDAPQVCHRMGVAFGDTLTTCGSRSDSILVISRRNAARVLYGWKFDESIIYDKPVPFSKREYERELDQNSYIASLISAGSYVVVGILRGRYIVRSINVLGFKKAEYVLEDADEPGKMITLSANYSMKRV